MASGIRPVKVTAEPLGSAAATQHRRRRSSWDRDAKRPLTLIGGGTGSFEVRYPATPRSWRTCYILPMVDSRHDLPHLQERWGRERAFHDALAEHLDPEAMPAVDPVHYDEAVLTAARIARGTRVLDLGCGQGDLTLALLARGAVVTALDLSPDILDVARRRTELYAGGHTATFVAAPVERTGLPSASFDVIVGRWILHHVDLQAAAGELARLLVPGGGRAVFLENSGANPILNFARDHIAGRFGIPRLGTKDERPLVRQDWRMLEESFASVHPEFPIVDVFELMNRQVFRYRSPHVAFVCHGLDRLIGRSGLRKYSYRVLVVAER